MAFDGITVACLVKELNDCLIGGRVYKIAQPENDELLLTIKTGEGQFRVVLSANASLPLLYLTDKNKPSPMTAPGFCMLLRKHIANGRILSITQPGLERVVTFDIEHLDEMGDLCRKKLIIELMGKHSNIIFTKEDGTIIDSIKHVSALVSSVREVLPGKMYFVPKTTEKLEIFETDKVSFFETIKGKPMPVYKALYSSFTGVSPILAQDICFQAGVDGESATASLTEKDYEALFETIDQLRSKIQNGDFAPTSVYLGKNPIEYAAWPLSLYKDGSHTLLEEQSMSSLVEKFYEEKNVVSRMRQRSVDLRKIVETIYERDIKKLDLQKRQMQDTEKRDTYRVYGELIHTYGYQAAPGTKKLEVVNFYDGKEVSIPLDPTKPIAANAQKYFDKYQKMKRTFEALSSLTKEVEEEIAHLESILTSLDLATSEEDLTGIREELVNSGYIKKKGYTKSTKVKNKPMQYKDAQGNVYLVGKNNLQNDELTFHIASNSDWWFHAKGMPGSHVILRCNPGEEPSDEAFENAGRLAAYYSKGRAMDKVEIDYVLKKQVKKPAGAKPGFVVYYTNYSLMAETDISGLTME